METVHCIDCDFCPYFNPSACTGCAVKDKILGSTFCSSLYSGIYNIEHKEEKKSLLGSLKDKVSIGTIPEKDSEIIALINEKPVPPRKTDLVGFVFLLEYEEKVYAEKLTDTKGKNNTLGIDGILSALKIKKEIVIDYIKSNYNNDYELLAAIGDIDGAIRVREEYLRRVAEEQKKKSVSEGNSSPDKKSASSSKPKTKYMQSNKRSKSGLLGAVAVVAVLIVAALALIPTLKNSFKSEPETNDNDYEKYSISEAIESAKANTTEYKTEKRETLTFKQSYSVSNNKTEQSKTEKREVITDTTKKGDTMVWITRYGSQYHSAPYCTGTKYPPTQVTLEEAKKHYQPCDVCNPPQ